MLSGLVRTRREGLIIGMFPTAVPGMNSRTFKIVMLTDLVRMRFIECRRLYRRAAAWPTLGFIEHTTTFPRFLAIWPSIRASNRANGI
jgi:hypothetical protein